MAALLHLRAGLQDDAAPSHARWFTGVGVALHGVTLGMEAAAHVRFGYAESLSAVAFGLMVVVALTALGRLAALALFLAPAATVLLALSFVAPSAHVAALDLTEASLWFPIHLGLVLAAVAGFFLEFAIGLTQLVVRRRLKQKKLAGLARYPALDLLDRAQFRALVFGIACLGLGVLSGAAWASSMLDHQSWLIDPKVWFTAGVWVWYLIVLQVRLTLGWHGRGSMLLSTIGFAALVFLFLGLDWVAQGFHAYGG